MSLGVCRQKKPEFHSACSLHSLELDVQLIHARTSKMADCVTKATAIAHQSPLYQVLGLTETQLLDKF